LEEQCVLMALFLLPCRIIRSSLCPASVPHVWLFSGSACQHITVSRINRSLSIREPPTRTQWEYDILPFPYAVKNSLIHSITKHSGKMSFYLM